LKMLSVFFLAFSLLLRIHAQESCANTYLDFCINQDDFHMGVAHGIHSLTLQELQFYFDDEATNKNNIPMINFDLGSSDITLPSVPDLLLNNSFVTPGMNSVDHILTNWETENFMMKNSSVLELLVHNLHMHETLSVAGKIYKKIKRQQNKRSKSGRKKKMKNLCGCITEEMEGKIMEELETTAKRFRETDDTKRAHWRRYYGYWWQCTCSQMKAKSASSPFPDHCPKEPALSSDPLVGPSLVKVQPLENSTIWEDWKFKLGMSKILMKRWNDDLAHYVYCKLNMA